MKILRPFLSIASPAGARAQLSIFIFHRVLASPDAMRPDEPDGARFDQMLGWIATGFRVLPLDEAMSRFRAGTLPARAAAITFDDGYEDNFSQALPLLKKHGLSATFFIATGYLDGGRMWNDTVIEAVRLAHGPVLDLEGVGLGRYAISDMGQRCRAAEQLLGRIKYLPVAERTRICDLLAEQVGKPLPDDLMMRRGQVLAMRQAGMQVGAHTSTHPILARLPADEVRREILASKTYLEALLNEPVTLFAYPNGKLGADYRAEDAQIVEACGFDAAFATNWGTAAPGCDPYQMPRFTPWDRNGLKFGLRQLRNLLAARRGG